MIAFISLFLDISFFEALTKYPELFLNALIAGIIIGIVAPLIGSIIIVRRLSLIADTLSHFSLAGVYFGVLLSNMFDFKISPIFMAVVFSILCTIIMEFLSGFFKNYKELSMPIVMSFGTALSGIFIALSKSSTALNGYLFGSIFTVSTTDLMIILSLTALIFIFIAIFYRKIITLCFDETQAKISGIKTKVLQYFITIVLAIFISLFIKIVGVLLISSLMIIPVSASMLIGRSYKQTCIISIIISELAILLGIYLSYTFSLPTGSLIVLLSIAFMIVIMIIRYIVRGKKRKPEDINNE